MKAGNGGAQLSESRVYADLFLVSFLLLFFELACIRWFGSTVVFLTFFTNIVLLATFLGMSVGCLAAESQRDWTRAVIPIFLTAAVLACASLWGYERFGRIMVDVGGQGSPQQVYFGTEYRARDVAAFVIPIELLAALFFALIAFVFVGIGQIMGRAFNEAHDRLMAYVCNIAGSLTGIVVFAVASYWRTAPMTWFTIVALIWAYFVRRRTNLQVYGLIAMVAFMGAVGYVTTIWAPYQNSEMLQVETWSPYYKILYTPALREIDTNNIGHQAMVSLELQAATAYDLPHLLNRGAGGKPFEDVLIIGAGSGNDVAAALANGAKHVDAVEIDPAIYDIGRAEHPDHPYQDPRVTVHIDDGRSFVRRTTARYDLIIYALVDSLVLHSGYSSIRLESFLFTQQAFDDVAARLKPGGVFAAYNVFRQGWIVGRIDRMAERAFGARPLVMGLPHVDTISSQDRQIDIISVILAGRDATVLSPIRRRFETERVFWLNERSDTNKAVNGFEIEPPALAGPAPGGWHLIAPALVDTRGIGRVPTDDWPFLYLREPAIPWLNVRSIVLLASLSIGILYLFRPVNGVRPNGRMFFLGAGFMLLETRSVVHLALLFGSTWIVNSVVFSAILVMILISNLFVLAVKPQKLWPYYALLCVSLGVGILVPMSTLLSLPGWQKIAVSCVVVFVPILFAGIIFGVSFRQSSEPNVDFGSNVAGAMFGGLAESLSLVIGFNYLLVVVLTFYLFSALFRRPALAPATVAV
jgi:SAM-dependent methyltransferase